MRRQSTQRTQRTQRYSRTVHTRSQRGKELDVERVRPLMGPELRDRTAAVRQVNQVSGSVVDAAMHVHSALGAGLLERAYHVALQHLLTKRGHTVRSEVVMPVTFDGLVIDVGFRADLVVDECVLVEIKAVSNLHPVHLAQMLTYLKFAPCEVGLIINFNVPHLRDGIQRVVPFGSVRRK